MITSKKEFSYHFKYRLLQISILTVPSNPVSLDLQGVRDFSCSPSRFMDSVLRCWIPYIGLKLQRKGSNLRTDYARKSGGRSPRLYPFAMCS